MWHLCSVLGFLVFFFVGGWLGFLNGTRFSSVVFVSVWAFCCFIFQLYRIFNIMEILKLKNINVLLTKSI